MFSRKAQTFFFCCFPPLRAQRAYHPTFFSSRTSDSGPIRQSEQWSNLGNAEDGAISCRHSNEPLKLCEPSSGFSHRASTLPFLLSAPALFLLLLRLFIYFFCLPFWYREVLLRFHYNTLPFKNGVRHNFPSLIIFRPWWGLEIRPGGRAATKCTEGWVRVGWVRNKAWKYEIGLDELIMNRGALLAC